MLLGLSTFWFAPVLHARSLLPGLFMSSPGPNAVLWGTVTMSAWADSGGLNDLQFQISGGPFGSVILSGPCSRAWDTRTVPDGSYTLSALAHDSVGTPVVAPPVVVYVQNSAPEIYGVVVQQVTSSTAQIGWQSVHVSDSQVDYGLSTSYGSSSPVASALVTNHSVGISGLSSSTTYHFRVRSRGVGGEIATSGDYVLVTAAAATGSPPPPSAPPPPTPTPTPGGCVTPDPFAAMGGGTCYAGGWLPPGIPVPGSTQSTQEPIPPTPTPAPAPAPALAPSQGGCVTPDPFAAMGGGTCYGGGWLPPGMTIPGGSPAPAPSAPSGPAPSQTGCTTADPFAAMGGGTCYAGGWLPPGMPIPGGGTAPAPAPAPSPAPPPSGPTAPGGCVGPDPFAAMGGGTCYGGGWLPPGIPVPGTAPAPAPAPPSVGQTVTGFGTVKGLQSSSGLIWVIQADSGVSYRPIAGFHSSFLQQGLRVAFTGIVASGSVGGALVPMELLSIAGALDR